MNANGRELDLETIRRNPISAMTRDDGDPGFAHSFIRPIK